MHVEDAKIQILRDIVNNIVKDVPEKKFSVNEIFDFLFPVGLKDKNEKAVQEVESPRERVQSVRPKFNSKPRERNYGIMERGRTLGPVEKDILDALVDYVNETNMMILSAPNLRDWCIENKRPISNKLSETSIQAYTNQMFNRWREDGFLKPTARPESERPSATKYWVAEGNLLAFINQARHVV